MKRAATLLLVLGLLAVLGTAPAQAAPGVKAKAVGQDPAQVAAYWTKARMRSAKPVAKVQGGGKPARSAYPFTRYEPTTYDARHGKVFFSDGGSNYVCSGTAITSGNESVVWTAGHCVNEGPGGFYTNWAFVPAYKDGARPYGTFAATRLQTTTGWGNGGDFSVDLGAATVGLSASGATLTDTVGGRGLAFDSAANQRYLSHGYPAASPFTGGRMYICDAQLALRDGGSPQTMGIGCDMTGGSSGGGWVTSGGQVASVNSYGYKTLRNVMFGPYQSTASSQLFAAAQ